MKYNYLAYCVISFVSLFLLFPCLSQSSSDFPNDLNASSGSAISKYESTMENQSLLFNGREYKGPKLSSEPSHEHPYFASEDLEVGSIRYNRQLYERVPLLYNLATDEVIIEYNDKQGNYKLIKLNSDLISHFTVSGHNYNRIAEDSLHELKNGFYDLLLDDDVALLAKRWKVFHQEISNRQVSMHYKEKVTYYLKNNKQYNPIRSKSSLLRILSDQKKPLRQYISQNKLNFLTDKEHAFTKVIAYYNKLNQ